MNAIVDKAECSGAHARSSDKVVFASTLLVTLNVRKQLSAFVGSTSEFAFTSCCPSSKSRFQSYFVNRTIQKLRRCIRNPMLLAGLCLYVAPKTVRLCSGKLADRRSHRSGEPVGGAHRDVGLGPGPVSRATDVFDYIPLGFAIAVSGNVHQPDYRGFLLGLFIQWTVVGLLLFGCYFGLRRIVSADRPNAGGQ